MRLKSSTTVPAVLAIISMLSTIWGSYAYAYAVGLAAVTFAVLSLHDRK